MRILFLSPRYPYPPRRGDQVRAFHLASGLADHAEVTLLSFGEGPVPPGSKLEVRNIEPTLGGRIAGNLRNPSPSLPLQARMFAHSAMRKAVQEELAKKPDVVHVTLARMGTYMPAATPGLHRHLDLVDSLSINMRTRADASRGPARAVFSGEARLMARYEEKLVAGVDSASLVSAADRVAPGLADATVIPNGIDVEGVPFAPREEGRPPVLAFFGNLGYFHNAEPARYVASEVLPLCTRPRAGRNAQAGWGSPIRRCPEIGRAGGRRGSPRRSRHGRRAGAGHGCRPPHVHRIRAQEQGPRGLLVRAPRRREPDGHGRRRGRRCRERTSWQPRATQEFADAASSLLADAALRTSIADRRAPARRRALLLGDAGRAPPGALRPLAPSRRYSAS